MRQKENSPVCEHCGYDERQQNLVHHLPVGTILQNQYLVGRVLGQGGFGITYMGWDQHLSMPVAIKEYYPNGAVQRHTQWGTDVFCTDGESPEIFEKHKDRFLKEARTLAQLAKIPEIVQIKSFFSANGTAYIVMEYVQGKTLKQHLKQMGRPMTEAEALSIMEPVLKALEKVHEQKLIHRDISPDNIMLPEGGGAKLIDFGTVRYTDASGETKSTEAVLKPGFAPMEQYNSRGNLGTWTDVYAICATFHYLLTGKVLPDAPSRIEQADALPLLEQIPNISRGFVEALKKGLAIRTVDRIQTISELYDYLYGQKALQETGKNRKPSVLKRAALLIMGVLILAASAYLISRKNETASVSQISAPTDPEEILQVTEPVETVPIDVPETTEATQPAPPAWINNVLAYDGDMDRPKTGGQKVYDLPVSRRQVEKVTFLDSIPDTDAIRYDVSHAQDGSVVAWVEGQSELYFAAEGGINASGKACRGLFSGYENVKTITFNGALHTDYAIDMFDMFFGCRNLSRIDLSSLDTHKVRDMSWMFGECMSLQTLDVSNFQTSDVTAMSGMFASCIELSEIDLRGFDTSNVADMSRMFESCTLLQRLDLNSLDTSEVTDMSRMFYDCQELLELDLSFMDTGNLNKAAEMFKGCKNLQKINLSGWNTAWVSNMEEMFRNCESLKELDLSHFDTSRVTNMTRMISGCYSLRVLELGQWDTSNVIGATDFYHASILPDGRLWTKLFW